jgi:hypothetical protein
VPTANKSRFLFLLFALSSVPHVSATQELYPNAAPVNGIQLVLSVASPDPNSKTPRFRVEFRNVVEHDLILNLGMMLANGRRQYSTALILNITDQQGVHRQFSLIGPGGIAGRVDPFVVPLPVGATFSIPIDLNKYWAAASKEFDYKLKAGTFSIQAEFRGRSVSERDANLDTKYVALFPYWEGVVDSNELRFDISGR